MGITRDLNVEPYFDDFEDVAVDKNYHRVLFKPSVAVQARELTQIQSIMQDQIERFGDNILIEGTIVKGGNFVEVNPLPFVKILDNNTNNQPVVLENYVGLKAVGATTGVQAQVITFATGFQSQSPNLNTLYVKYTSASTSTSYSGQDTFREDENINIINSIGEIVDTVTAAGTRDNNSIGNGYGVRCGDGIVYQKGHFITFEDQIVVLSKYTTAPNDVVVGFRIEESFVDSFTDESLLDNAAGFPNENAPGADRLQLIPVLEVRTVTEAKDIDNYFAIQEYQLGRIVRKHTRTQYSIIGDEIARRTSEESGNYSLGKINVRIGEFVANTTTGEISDELLAAYVSPGISYVDGNRVEILSEYKTTFNKSTDFLTEEQQNITTTYGNYVVVDNVLGDFDFTTFPTVELRSAVHGQATLDATTENPVEAGSLLGTARVRSFTKEIDGRYRLYLFDINVTSGDFSAVKSVRFDGAGQAGIADIILDANNNANLIDANYKKVIFSLSREYIKSVSSTNCDYTARKRTTTVIGGTPVTSFTVTLGTDEEWPYSGTFTASDLINEFIAIKSSTGEVLTINEVTINSTTQASITLSAGVSSDTIILYHNVKKINVKPIGKELDTYYARISANTHTDLASGKYSLGAPDAFEIVNIWKSSDDSGFTEAEAIANVSIVDVTNQFTLFDNQKDSMYDLSYIQKRSTAAFANDDSLLVKFRAFTKNTSSGDNFGQSFFSIDSYPLDGSGTPSPQTIEIEEVPVYTSEDGSEYNLRDVLDFRPYAANTIAYVTDSTSPVGTVNDSIDTLTQNIDFGSVALNFPTPNKFVELDYDYYLARVDRLFLDAQGLIRVVEGISSERPSAPKLPSNAMELATLLVAPFPSLPASVANRSGHPEYAVSYITPQNRRYTMEDIGKLDRRVKQIEYYTALNSLEQKTDNLAILDSNGQDRFKNGIFVDNFTSYSAADVKNPAFSTSIMPNIGEIAPRHRQWFLDLRVDSSTNLNVDNNALTLTYSESNLIDQPYASITRSCTNDFYKFTGDIRISPEYDGGADTTRAPDIEFPQIDLVGAFSDFTEALGEFVPIQGETIDVDTQSTTTVSRNRRWWGWGGRTATRQTTTTTTTTREDFEVLAGQETSQIVGDFVTDARFNPFMRSIEMEIEVFGMLPNKTLYFYFDGVSVDDHVASADLLSESALTSREPGDQKILNRTSEYGVATITTDANGVARAIFRIPSETFYVGDRLLEIASASTYGTIKDSITYAKKMYHGFNFNVEKSRLLSTTRMPEFGSTQTISVDVDVQTQTIRTGNPPRGGRDPIAQTFFISSDMSTDNVVQLTSIDVYFASKSTENRGVKVEIVEAVNGFPGDRIIPFSSVRKSVDEVSVDLDLAITPTTFTFESPVTLQTDKEYALIVQPEGNDPNYQVWIARTGDRDVTTDIALATDTNAGVLFTSSNKRAWTPYQNENLKFTLRKAAYNTSVQGSATLTNKNHEFFSITSRAGEFNGDEFVFVDKTSGDPDFIETANNVSATQASSILTADAGTFTGFEAGDYIVAKSNDSRQVLKVLQNTGDNQLTVNEGLLFTNTAIEVFKTVTGRLTSVHTSQLDDEVVLTLYNSSASTGNVFTVSDNLRGADSLATCTIGSIDNIPVTYFNANIYKTTSTQTRVTSTFDGTAIELSKTNYIKNANKFIKSRSNEITEDAGSNSFELVLNLETLTTASTADSSPFVDYSISTVMANEYIFNDLAIDDTTEDGNFGDAKSKYISKTIELASGMDASDMRFYLTGYRPVGSNIRVYVKAQNFADSRSFNSINWTELELKDATNLFSSSSNRNDFKEFEFQFGTAAATVAGGDIVKLISGSDISDSISYETPEGNVFNTYKYFSIKVVLTATSHTNIPRVRDIRAIALA